MFERVTTRYKILIIFTICVLSLAYYDSSYKGGIISSAPSAFHQFKIDNFCQSEAHAEELLLKLDFEQFVTHPHKIKLGECKWQTESLVYPINKWLFRMAQAKDNRKDASMHCGKEYIDGTEPYEACVENYIDLMG